MNILLLIYLVANAIIGSSAWHQICKVECSRKKNSISLGFDIAMKSLLVDVGQCMTNITECDPSSHMCIKQCIPRSHERREYITHSGPMTVDVIRSCYPTYHHCLDTCEMKPQVIYLFPNSKYQTRVDIKKCAGYCNQSGYSCIPTKIKTQSIDGPNGAVILSVIKECKCSLSVCYLQNHYQSYWNYFICNETGKLDKEEKTINIGQCIGNCDGIYLPGRCFPSVDNCLIYVGRRQARCTPAKISIESYFDSNLQKIDVPVIKQCACG